MTGPWEVLAQVRDAYADEQAEHRKLRAEAEAIDDYDEVDAYDDERGMILDRLLRQALDALFPPTLSERVLRELFAVPAPFERVARALPDVDPKDLYATLQQLLGAGQAHVVHGDGWALGPNPETPR